jgi:hypothetical protein
MLSSEQLANLRQQGLISSEEFAFIAGDLLIAENAISNERRVVGESSLLTETNKRVLKG